MKKTLAAIAVCGLCASPAFAVSDNVAGYVKTIEGIAGDPAKLKTYCEMAKMMDSADDSEDEAKNSALDQKMQEYLKQLGSDFEAAFEAGADLDPDSEDGKAYDAAFDKIEAKCK